ncbi:Helix-turn-helix [Mycobacterium tuberculosis]|nr:Helix-turn-helix [Mycobacterium tuberculosis]
MLGNSGFGKFIEYHRIASGYKSQRRLADKTGISSATISRIEAEIQKPEPETLKVLAKHLHTTSLVELMVVCGYWDEDELLEPISLQNAENRTSPSSEYERELLEKIDLSDDELMKQFKLVVDGRELSEQETKSVLAFVRTLRHNG